MKSKPTSFSLPQNIGHMLLALSEAYKLKKSELIRRLIEDAYRRWEVPGLKKLPPPEP